MSHRRSWGLGRKQWFSLSSSSTQNTWRWGLRCSLERVYPKELATLPSCSRSPSTSLPPVVMRKPNLSTNHNRKHRPHQKNKVLHTQASAFPKVAINLFGMFLQINHHFLKSLVIMIFIACHLQPFKYLLMSLCSVVKDVTSTVKEEAAASLTRSRRHQSDTKHNLMMRRSVKCNEESAFTWPPWSATHSLDAWMHSEITEIQVDACTETSTPMLIDRPHLTERPTCITHVIVCGMPHWPTPCLCVIQTSLRPHRTWILWNHIYFVITAVINTMGWF